MINSRIIARVPKHKAIITIYVLLKGELGERLEFCGLLSGELDVDVDVLGDIDVVVEGVDIVVEDIEEEQRPEESSLLGLNDEGDFSGESVVVGTPVDVGAIETDPGEDVQDSVVIVAAAAFSAG